MPYHILFRKARDPNTFNPRHNPQSLDKARGLVGLQVNLRGIAGNHHPAAFPHARQEHLHLRGGGILRLIQNGVAMGQGAAAHESQRRDFNLPGRDAPRHLFSGQHVMQSVVKRAEIGVHLFLHIARQEAEPFTRFHRGPRQHNPVNTPRLQQRHTLRHR